MSTSHRTPSAPGDAASAVSTPDPSLAEGIPATLPEPPPDDPAVTHAPARRQVLSEHERALALRNALRYVPAAWHQTLAPEFAAELARDGRIYMRRLRPQHAMKARPLAAYPAKSRQAAAIMLMIQNNLDPAVAQYPHELITYGGNGTVFQNWAQYRLTMKYLSEMSDEQTLVLYSGHPLGLFPSHPEAPRLVVTCGMVIPDAGTPDEYERLAALGVSSYGQMTAGSFMYIGPQGIVHGTTITLLNAGRKYLGLAGDLAGKVYVTSGLGGMSGAQAKAAVIAGAVGVIAEVDEAALIKRHEQGWLQEYERDLDRLLARIERARAAGEALSLGYLGNVVDLWERLVRDGVQVELGSDQTSLHNPYAGGYYPAGLSVAESNAMMRDDPAGFRERVQESLRRHAAAINAMSARGMHFWDYGNAFLLEAGRAGAEVMAAGGGGDFRYPSYVEDIMGPMCFDYGFGPFRWVCTSGSDEDLATSDRIAAEVIEQMLVDAPSDIAQQLGDNLRWIREAGAHEMVVGSKARILYSDSEGRTRIALAFNRAIRDGAIRGPIVLGRDHHDVSGTDSPYRETAHIRDGSNRCADMAVHNVIGDAFRGATWVSLHNGGGVGWGQVINGGFGMVLDGSEEADARARSMILWDVNNGIARRAWAGNAGAVVATQRAEQRESRLRVTLPHQADDAVVRAALAAHKPGESDA
ncbi:urocanate hydratase [Haliangium ochraceum]|uniref:Urocanate hydratase n=1 Tax=Haliangium ochraceum (strain DSM 14365 / JCM 11303 / SMP-2) TaxID=502025 RepID=D0LH96_HALO1|nr:urocanate hydratase [Haliangium ochraceum]ACY18241.1 urocanate hydratase [Haliangium ochraceum DSM 14365]